MTDDVNSTHTTSDQPIDQHRRNRPIWMPMYWGDYLGDTRHLDTLEHGAYMLLIGAYWQRGGPLPYDDKYLRKVTGMHGNSWRYVKKTIIDFFYEKDGYLYHKRLEKELLKSCTRIASAKRAACVRWSDRNANHNHNHKEDKKVLEAPQPASVPETRKPSSRGSRLPEGWNPSVESHTYSVGLLGADGSARELDKFRDYWMSLPGQRGVKLDWNRTWRNWCRTALERRGSYNGHSGPRPLQDDSLSASRAAGRLAEAAERGEFEFAPRPKPPSSEGSRHIRLLSKG